MTTLRLPCWLRDAVGDASSEAAVEPWMVLCHWLSAHGEVRPPPQPLPAAVAIRYGGHFGADGLLSEERLALRESAPRQKRTSRRRATTTGRAALARDASKEE